MADPCTYYLVAKGGTIAGPILLTGTNAGRSFYGLATLNISATGNVSSTVDITSKVFSVCGVFSATSSIWVDNSNLVHSGVPGGSANDGLSIGGYGGFPRAGKIAYLAVYQGAHDATQRQEIMSTLSAKYGPPLNLLARYDGDTVVQAGNLVSQWTDLGNSGDNTNRHALAAGAARPTWLASDPDFNGHGSLAFASGIRMLTGTFAPACAMPITVYAVNKLTALPTANQYVFDMLGSATTQFALIHGADGVVSTAPGGPTSTVKKAPVAEVTCAVLDSTRLAVYRNSISNTALEGAMTATTLTGLTIGTAYSLPTTVNFTGKMAYLAFYAGVHDLETRTRIMQELAIKYGITLDAQSPILDASRDVLVTGQGVSKWSDQSLARDTNKDALQTTDADRPAYLTSDPDFNGKASIGFAGTHQRLTAGEWAKPMVQPCTEVIVVKMPASIPGNMYILSTTKSSGSGGGYACLLTGTGTLKLYAGTVLESTAIQPGFAVILVEYAGAASRVFYNNAITPIASGNVGAGGASGRVLGGNYVDNYTFNGGKIAYYTNFPRTLSADERKTLMDKLKAEYKPWEPLDELPSAYYDGDVVVQAGGLVSQWTDRGPSLDANRHALSSGSDQPTWTASDPEFNGHGSLTFNYAHKLVTGTFSASVTQPATFYFVGTPDITGSAGIIFDGKVGAGRRLYVVSYATVTTMNAGGAGLASTAVYNHVRQVYCSVANTTASFQTFNGSVVDGAGSIGTDFLTGITIGGDASTGGTKWKGKMAMLAVFPGVHSPELRAKIMKWLSTRFNIPIDVPIARYEPNAQGVVRYQGGNTISKLYNQSGVVEAAKDAVQATPANMPTWIEKDPDFNGRPSLSFVGDRKVTTGVISGGVPLVATHYYVVKMPPSLAVGELTDGVSGSGKQVIYTDTLGLYAGQGTGSMNCPITLNKVSVVAVVFNGASSSMHIDTPHPSVSGSTTGIAITSVTLGNYWGNGYPWLGKVAHQAIYAGAHDFVTRERIMKELGEQFNVHIYSPLDDLPLAYYDADYVRKFSATQVDRLYSLDGSGDANRHAKQDTSATMPTFVDNDPDFNGHRSLLFSTTQQLDVPAITVAQPCTFYYVTKFSSNATYNAVFDGNTTRMLTRTSGSPGLVEIFAGVSLKGSTGNYLSTLVVGSSVFSGASSAAYVNSVTTYVSGNAGTNALSDLRIGNLNGSGYAANKIALLAVYAGVHDATQRARIMRWLGAKYGITVT